MQIDVTKVGPKGYQFTAIDDCTRFRALRPYPNKKVESTIDFLGHILDTFSISSSQNTNRLGNRIF